MVHLLLVLPCAHHPTYFLASHTSSISPLQLLPLFHVSHQSHQCLVHYLLSDLSFRSRTLFSVCLYARLRLYVMSVMLVVSFSIVIHNSPLPLPTFASTNAAFYCHVILAISSLISRHILQHPSPSMPRRLLVGTCITLTPPRHHPVTISLLITSPGAGVAYLTRHPSLCLHSCISTTFASLIYDLYLLIVVCVG